MNQYILVLNLNEKKKKTFPKSYLRTAAVENNPVMNICSLSS